MKWGRKWWWLIVAVFAVALIVGWEDERCQAQADECRTSYAAQAQSERLSGNVSVDQQASEQQAIAAACEPNGYFCRLLSPAILPTVLLVLIGIGAVWAALRTLRAIEKQADAQINSERAWLMAELIPMALKFDKIGWHRKAGSGWAPLSLEEVVRGEHLKHKLRFTNMGKTPGAILSFQVGHSILAKDGSYLPTGDSVRSVETTFDRVLPGNESADAFEVDVFHLAGDLFIEAQAAGVFAIHGWVKYQHVFSDVEECYGRFCYIYSPTLETLTRVSQQKQGQAKSDERPVPHS